MQASSAPFEVLIAGGGIAALEASLALREHAGDRVQITWLAPGAEFRYRPTRVGEPFGHPRAQAHPLAAIAADLRLLHHADRLSWVDTASRQVHTEAGRAFGYDALLLALGARQHAAMSHALTLDPDRLDDQLHGVVQDLEGGWIRSIAFIVPATPAWPVPLYELALMSAARAYESYADTTVTLITPENRPLAIFGDVASDAVSQLLSERRINIIAAAHAAVHTAGTVTLYPEHRQIRAERIVTLPELHGPAVPGIPRRGDHGFVMVDRHGRVAGLERVFAAGDIVDGPVKHGGLAAQQADAAAESIAALAGLPIEPRGLVPTLQATLWDGERSLYLQARLTGTRGSESRAGRTPPWQPAGKVHARLLGPYLAARAGDAAPMTVESAASG